MSDLDFVHLHLHTEGSLADAMLRPKELAARIKELGMKSVAITDHGNMFKVVHFYKACKSEGIKPILGMETYVAPRVNTIKEHKIDDANYHLVLLAENNDGYQNLIQIASNASISGMYYKPRTDKNKLRKWHNGIIALSACLGGEVQQYLLANDYKKAKESALMYEDIFGKGNFYLELQNHGLPEQVMVNELLIKLSKETGIPLVCTNDCHYLYHSDSKPHDILMAIQAKTTIYDDKRKIYNSDQFYLKSPQEMYELFNYIPEALENTVKIADRCNVEIDFGSNKLPPFTVPSWFNGSNYDFLKKLVYDGAMKRYGQITEDVEERIEYELSVIEKMGYVNYFLITWDFFRFCEDGTDEIGQPSPEDWKPILTSCGRGSGAGSIILYTLGITQIDPLEYDLLFERFLDPSRISMPDIDSDFEDSRRQEVIDYVIRKYGRKSVCQIITYGTLAARAAIRAVGRALDLPYAVQDQTAKMIPKEPGITIKEGLEMNPDFKRKYDNDETIKYLVDMAMRVEGLPIYTGTHAAGVLITDSKGVTAHVPVWDNDGAIVAQYDKDILEELGLLKMDFLGLKTLGVISEAIDNIYKNHGVKVDLNELYKCKDLKPLQLLEEGKTDGIFQLEGAGLTEFIKELRPRSIEEWIAAIALYRPGPMQFIPTYLANKRDPDNIDYPFEELKPILQGTYGVLCYQEQCMKTVIAVAGYEKSDSDGFRKVIAKKKKHLIPLHRKWFIEGRNKIDVDEDGKERDYGHPIPGGLANGHKREDLEIYFDKMEDFGKYCFNKSHAAAYAVVGNATAWLKFYYPVEFMAALLNSVQGDLKQVSRYINHCRDSLGIEIIPPDVNVSADKFIPTKDGKIIYTLNVKFTSKDALDSIVFNREKDGPYKTFEDFIERNMWELNKQTINALGAVGAFKSLGVINSHIVAGAADISDRISKTKQVYKRAQASHRPFDIMKWMNIQEYIPSKLNEFPNRIQWALERKYLGLYLTGNPIYDYMYYVEKCSNFKLEDMDYEVDEETGMIILKTPLPSRKSVRIISMFSNIKETVTRKRKEPMAITEIEDLTGSAKMLIWPQIYEQYKEFIKEDEVLDISGYVKVEPDEPPVIICESIEKLELPKIKKIVIKENDPYKIREVMMKNMIENKYFIGNTPVYVEVNNVRLLLDSDYWINLNCANLEDLNYEILEE